jgi:hypothetical protein
MEGARAMALTGRPWKTTMDPNAVSTTMSGATTTVSPDASATSFDPNAPTTTEGGITLG